MPCYFSQAGRWGLGAEVMAVSSHPFARSPADSQGATSSARPHAGTPTCLHLLRVPLRSPRKGCATAGWGERFQLGVRVEYRTGLNSRKYFQITKSMAQQQGCGGGPAHGPFTASPEAGAGLQLAPSNPMLSQHLPTCKDALQLSAEGITQERLLYSRGVKKCQCCPFSC